MAAALAGVDWSEIKIAWCNGATAEQLSTLHGVKAASIRSRAMRGQWTPKRPSASQTVVAKATQRIVRQAAGRIAKRVEGQIDRSVDACIRESITLGQSLMQRAGERIGEVEDGNLSGVATVARTGVDLWRKSLGLDTTGGGGGGCAINFSFTLRGSPDTLQASVFPAPTLDAEEV